MIEYLYDAIRATAGDRAGITANITDASGNYIENVCSLMLHNDEEMITSVKGEYLGEGDWYFEIPSSVTSGLKGRYFYCICEGSNKLCFKTPIYFI